MDFKILLKDFTIFYVLSLVVFCFFDMLIDAVNFSTKDKLLYSLIMPVLICVYTALENGYEEGSDGFFDDED